MTATEWQGKLGAQRGVRTRNLVVTVSQNFAHSVHIIHLGTYDPDHGSLPGTL